MGITPRFEKAQVLKELQKGHLKIENGIIRILQQAGEQFIDDAKDALSISPSVFPKGDYTDRTANLRSSIGYFVLNNGQLLNSDIRGTSEGIAAGKTLLASIPKGGYQLIGVAGMDYASYVEARGYNVITSQKDIAIVNIGKNLNRFKDRLNKLGANVDFDINDIVLTATR